MIFFLTSCGGGSSSNKEVSEEDSNDQQANEQPAIGENGIGPITLVTLTEIDPEMAKAGQSLFETYCVTCHKVEEKYIGPAMAGIINRRTPEWIMNMILNPQEMTEKDPIAKELLVEYNNVPMVGQGITEEQARQILEYFRTL